MSSKILCNSDGVGQARFPRNAAAGGLVGVGVTAPETGGEAVSGANRKNGLELGMYKPVTFANVLAGIVLLCAVNMAYAVSPSFSTVTPRGIPRGAETEVTLHGNNLADIVDIMFHDTGIELVSVTPVDAKNAKAVLRPAPDCRVGTHGIRLRTKTGVSELKVISVGALNEISEEEPNNSGEEAPDITLGTTVNGVVTSEDVDYYGVTLKPGDRIAVEVEALRLGDTLFDPKIRLFGPEGHERVSEDDTQLFRQDAGFVYTSTEDGRHLIAISEAAYGGNGNCRYRLHVGQFPRPMAVTPMGAVPGSEVEVTWLGDAGAGTQKLTVPEGTDGIFQLAAQTDAGIAPTTIPFRATPFGGVREAEPNNNREEATQGAITGAFDGVIGEPGDRDFFKFEGKKDQVVEFRVWARELGSPLDSVLVVYKPDGSGLASDDDAAVIDSQVRVTLPEDGVYWLSVRDHLDRGGETFAYRVEASTVSPTLRVSLLENRPVSSIIPQNNHTFLLANVSRRDFGGPVKVELLGLPAGVTATSPVIPDGESQRPIIIHGAADAALAGALVDVRGTLQKEGSNVTGGLSAEVRLIQGRNDTTFFGRDVDRLAMAVSEPAPFSVELVPPPVPTVTNTHRMLTVKATRAEGFTGDINLSFPWLPNGMGGGTAKIPGDQTETQIRLEVRNGVAIQTHELFVSASGGGYLLCSPPAPVEVQDPWVNFNLANAVTEQGKPVDLVVNLEQKTPFEGAFQAELAGLPKGVTATPLEFNKDTAELKFPLSVAEDAPAGKFGSLSIHTVIKTPNGEILHQSARAELKVQKPLPPKLKAAAPPPEKEKEKAPDAPERKTRFPTT